MPRYYFRQPEEVKVLNVVLGRKLLNYEMFVVCYALTSVAP